MGLAAGTRLGSYEVLSTIGAGGMGEVYRARDTRLQRDVALKMLPAALAGDRERLARFEREAQVLASLNHPNIAAIYGLEESAGQQAIVMELVEGQEVAGPVPVPDALRVARQVAEAVEFAHEKGVIHRDLKPANIKVTPDGVVKVLDFGLAKALDFSDTTGSGSVGGAEAVTYSPTLSLAATHVGVILGTAAYMSPEQAKGRAADRRADVWAFGAVLYELLAGRRLFGGDSVAETLASVMKEPIALDALPADTPRAIRRLVARCLDRDLRRRLQSIAEARIVLEDAIAGTTADGLPLPAPRVFSPRTVWLGAGLAVVLVAAAFGLGRGWGAPAATTPTVARFIIPPPEGTVLTNQTTAGPNLALSPDGRYVAYAVNSGPTPSLWLRALDSLDAQRLERTEGGLYPFWSPDSQQIAYFANGKMMRISADGGAPLTICDAEDGEGGSWFQPEGEDGIIVFAPGQAGPLHQVPAQGGTPIPVTTLAQGESAHIFPQVLPGGRKVLFTARGAKPGVYVQDLGSAERTLVLGAQERAVFAPPGFLLYVRDSVLLAHRFNLDALKLEGEPVSLADDVRNSVNSGNAGNSGLVGRSAFAVSPTGVLAYRGLTVFSTQVRWFARDGRPGDVVLPSGGFHLELSPDDTLLVTTQGIGMRRDLWVKDLSGGQFRPLTSLPGSEMDPRWSPDARRVAFTSAEGVSYTDVGSGKAMSVPGGRGLLLLQWTPDGRRLIAGPREGLQGGAVSLSAPEGSVPQPGSAGEGLSQAARDVGTFADLRASPDGKWVAYVLGRSGTRQVNVAAFSSFANRRQVSVDGGINPLWRADGRELFFRTDDRRVMAADVVASNERLEIGPPRELFRVSPFRGGGGAYDYAVTRDGQRFLVREPVGGTSPIEPLFVVTNWPSLVTGK